MEANPEDIDSIGPQISLDSVHLPLAVGDGFARLYESDNPPATAADWIALVSSAIERERGRRPTVEDLCTTDDGDHAFVGDTERQTYICVLDPLVYPFLTGEPGTIESTTRVRGTEVTFEVTAEDVSVSHEDALVSIGVSNGADGISETPIETVYQEVCGYIQTFEDRAEYESWADDVDAATTAVDATEGIGIARELAHALFEPAEASTAEADEDCAGTNCC